jgi:hypothetical protein
MSADEITTLKVSMGKMETKIDDIKSDVGDIKKTLADYIEKAETKYAAKWVEKAIVWVTITVLGVVIVAIVGTVIQRPVGQVKGVMTSYVD